MTGREDTCRPVTLPSGETVRVRGACDPTLEEVEAISEVLDAARARFLAERPPNPAADMLYSRLTVRTVERDILMRDVAKEAGVRLSTVVRIAQGIMPGDEDMAAIEAWLTNNGEA